MALFPWIIIFDHGCSVCPYRLGLFLRCFVSFVFYRFRCHFRVGQSAVTDRILCLIDTVGSFQIFNNLIAHIFCFPFCINHPLFVRHLCRDRIWCCQFFIFVPSHKPVTGSHRIFRFFNIGIVFAHDGIHIGAALAVKGNIVAIPQVIPV